MFKKALQRLTIKKAIKFKSFDLLRLHAKSYRAVKKLSEQILQKSNLTVIDWSLLGLLIENPEGIRFSIVASMLGVEPPFVTEVVGKLSKNKIIISELDPTDSRAKILRLTKRGENKVLQNEELISKKILEHFSEIDHGTFDGFYKTIQFLSDIKKSPID